MNLELLINSPIDNAEYILNNENISLEKRKIRVKGILGDIGIDHLDLLGSRTLRLKCAELGIFETNLKEYSKALREKIIRNIIDPVDINLKTSYIRVPGQDLEDNLRLVWNEFSEWSEIETLDDITKVTSKEYKHFWDQLRVKRPGRYAIIKSIHKTLIKLDLLPKLISSYKLDNRSDIIKHALHPGGRKSPYTDRTLLKKDIWDSNIKTVFKSLQKREKIDTVDDISRTLLNKYHGFFVALGAKKSSGNILVSNVKKTIMDLGLLPKIVSRYSTRIQKKIAQNVFSSPTGNGSYFVNGTLKRRHWTNNIGTIVIASELRHLDEINGTFLKGKQNLLIKKKLFKKRINQYNAQTQAEIIENILHRPHCYWETAYLGDQVSKTDRKLNAYVVWKDLGIKTLDGVCKDITSDHAYFWRKIGVYAQVDIPKVSDVQKEVAKRWLSSSVMDYTPKQREAILNNMINQRSQAKPYYSSKHLKNSQDESKRLAWKENIHLAWDHLADIEEVETLDDVKTQGVGRYTGFLKDIGVPWKETGTFSISDIKRTLKLHNFFNKDGTRIRYAA